MGTATLPPLTTGADLVLGPDRPGAGRLGRAAAGELTGGGDVDPVQSDPPKGGRQSATHC